MRSHRHHLVRALGRGRVALAVVAYVAVASLALLVHSADPAEAHDEFGFFNNVFNGDDGLWNWDFRNDDERNWDTKDWPVHIVFWNNATVNRVKGTDGTHRLDNDVFKTTGGAKWARFEDDGFWEYDADSGRKKFNCKLFADANKWTEHFRVYGDNTNDRNWAPGWGFYVLVTTHFDFDDPEIGGQCNDAKFGWDELAEENITWYFSQSDQGPEWGAHPDWKHLHNFAAVDELIGGNLHHRDSDGNATVIRVP